MDDVVKEIRRSGEAVIVLASGEVTLDKSPALHKRLLELCSEKPKHLVFDMSRVSHIDSAGVGTLVDIFRRLRTAKSRMSLAGMNDRVRSVFEVTKLDKFFSIYPTADEALEA